MISRDEVVDQEKQRVFAKYAALLQSADQSLQRPTSVHRSTQMTFASGPEYKAEEMERHAKMIAQAYRELGWKTSVIERAGFSGNSEWMVYISGDAVYDFQE